MADAAPRLEARDLSRRYGRRWALRHVSARFHAGTLTTVVGHNGAGKSTLLGLLSGRLRPDDGQVLLDGAPLHKHPNPHAARAALGVLAHHSGLYPDLDARENLAFFARLVRGRAAPTEAELDALLARHGLAHAARRPVATYSRGMVQRLGLARLVAQGALVWLVDEPSTGLDAEGRDLLLTLVADAKAAGRAIVVVTHDPSLVAGLSDTTLRLDAGRLVASAEPVGAAV